MILIAFSCQYLSNFPYVKEGSDNLLFVSILFMEYQVGDKIRCFKIVEFHKEETRL